jgi:hypothetical protein
MFTCGGHRLFNCVTMAVTVTIPAIYWGNPPTSAQTITLEYKLYSASSWTLIDSSVQVDTDGTILDSPLPSVAGLTEGTVYYLKASNNCESPLEEFIQAINT